MTPFVQHPLYIFHWRVSKDLGNFRTPTSVLMQGRSWQVIGGLINLFSGSLDPPSEHHLYWFLTSFEFRYLLQRSLWRERRITLQSLAKFFWGAVMSCKIQKSEMWLRNIFAPFCTPEAFQLITGALAPNVWECYIGLVVCIYIMSLPLQHLEMLFWMLYRRQQTMHFCYSPMEFWKQILS